MVVCVGVFPMLGLYFCGKRKWCGQARGISQEKVCESVCKFDELDLGGVIKENKKEKRLILSDTTFFPLWLVYFFLCHFAGVLSHILAEHQSEGKRESE